MVLVKVMLITAGVIIGWYLLSQLFKFNIFKDNHRVNNMAYIHALVFGIFAFLLAWGLLKYYVFSTHHSDNFWVNTGVLFSLYVAALGLIISLIYKGVVKLYNKEYLEKHKGEEELFSLQVPISVLFDMGIILLGFIAYKQEAEVLVGICASLLVGEHFSLTSLVSKKPKSESLWSNLKKVPPFMYLCFLVALASVYFDLRLEHFIGFLIGIFAGVIVIAILESRKKAKGQHSDLYELQESMSKNDAEPSENKEDSEI